MLEDLITDLRVELPNFIKIDIGFDEEGCTIDVWEKDDEWSSSSTEVTRDTLHEAIIEIRECLI